MKRGTPSHPKVAALMRRLGINRREAVGLLEMLWHFTAQYARRGDIGHWPDDEIAGAVEWTGDASQLIGALVETRWLDRSEDHRLVVHNWSHHADDTVRKALERSKEGFCDLSPPRRDSGEKSLPAGEKVLPCLSLALPCHSPALPESEAAGAASPPTRPKRRSAAAPKDADPEIWGTGEIRLHAGRREWVGVTQVARESWERAYPAVAIDIALSRAAVWCVENPARGRKKNYGKFLTGWFSRDQDRAGPTFREQHANGTHAPEPDGVDTIVRLYEERKRQQQEKIACSPQTSAR